MNFSFFKCNDYIGIQKHLDSLETYSKLQPCIILDVIFAASNVDFYVPHSLVMFLIALVFDKNKIIMLKIILIGIGIKIKLRSRVATKDSPVSS